MGQESHWYGRRQDAVWRERGTMELDDLILVSVDDHVVEPADLFEGRLPGEVPGPGAAGRSPRTTVRSLGVRRAAHPQRRAQRRRRHGRPRSTASSRPRFDEMRTGLLRHPRARQRHERQRRARLDVLPALPAVLRPAVRRDRRTRTSAARRCCGPTTTGTSTSGAAPTPAASSRSSIPPIWDPQLMADEIRRVAEKGCHAVTFSENPEKLGCPSLTATTGTRSSQACEDEGTVVCLHIGSSSAVGRSPSTTRRST